ncbi:MAG: hypothetical protein WAM91_18085 [Candidatus Acidiferrales bacterium]
MWIADVHKTCRDPWLAANGAADFEGLETTDRKLLLNGLPSDIGAQFLKTSPTTLQIGNLELIFDANEKLDRLRIHEAKGRARLYVVREPKENLNV